MVEEIILMLISLIFIFDGYAKRERLLRELTFTACLLFIERVTMLKINERKFCITSETGYQYHTFSETFCQFDCLYTDFSNNTNEV